MRATEVIIKHKCKLFLLTYFGLFSLSLLYFEVTAEIKSVLEILATSLLSILGILFFYLWESENRREEQIEEQYETLKNLVYDMNDGLGHINGLVNNFHTKVVPSIEELISKNDISYQFKIETSCALETLKSQKGSTMESFKAIRVFMDSFNASLKRNNIPFRYPSTTLTFNFRDELLNSVFNNFKQFNLREFKELRGKLLSLRHIYDVYRTNVEYVFWESPSINHLNVKKEALNINYEGLFYDPHKKDKFSIASNNHYYFVHDFAENCIKLLKELLKNKKMRFFYSKEKTRLTNLDQLLQ